MKYVAYDYFDNFYPGILGICDTEADVQELILAAAEEGALNWFNNNITWAPVPSGAYVLHEWKEMAALRHKSLEHYILNEGSVLFLNKIYESELN